MLWSSLVKLKKWCPLAQIPYCYGSLGEGLCKLEETKYFLWTPFVHSDNEKLKGRRGHFLSALVWACSDGAALRAIMQEKEKDEEIVLPPPPELLPHARANSYGAILSGLTAVGATGIAESAQYRWTDGSFLQRSISSSLADYHFRSREHKANEIPYAILWRMIHPGR